MKSQILPILLTFTLFVTNIFAQSYRIGDHDDQVRSELQLSDNHDIESQALNERGGCDTDSLEMVDYFFDFNGGFWFYDTISGGTWLSDPLGEWAGVTVDDNGCVTDVDISGFFASGDIAGLGNLELSQIQSLIMSNNGFTGTLPDFQGMPNLEILDISLNSISGAVPDFTNLFELTDIILRENNVTGIPDFGNSPNLQTIDMSRNGLTVVPDFENQDNLSDLNLRENNIGGIPDFGNVSPNLTKLNLGRNQLTGTIEDWNLPNLTELYLDDNEIDALPCFSNLGNLEILHVQNNNLTFEHIICNGASNDYQYCFQDSVGIELVVDLSTGDDYTIDLMIDEAVTTSQYAWRQDGVPFSNTSINELVFNDIQLSSSGTYTCNITNLEAPCLTLYSRPVSLMITINGVSELPSFVRNINISPIPVADVMTIELQLGTSTELTIELIDMRGSRVMDIAPLNYYTPGSHTIHSRLNESLQSGMYILVFSNDTSTFAHPVMVK